MKSKLIATTAIAAGLTFGAAGTAAAAPGNGNGPGGGNSCAALTEAHMTIIAAQGLQRHLTLGVHTVAFDNLLAKCG